MTRPKHLALRIAVSVACLVPLAAGGAGAVLGPAMLGVPTDGVSSDLDSHYRYLSGLLLAIGLGFVSTIPNIEHQGARFRLLTCLVIVGGLSRMLSAGPLSLPMKAALVMELAVAPALALWQYRVARSSRQSGGR